MMTSLKKPFNQIVFTNITTTCHTVVEKLVEILSVDMYMDALSLYTTEL